MILCRWGAQSGQNHGNQVEWWLPGAEGGGDGEWLFNREHVLVLQDEKVLEV